MHVGNTQVHLHASTCDSVLQQFLPSVKVSLTDKYAFELYVPRSIREAADARSTLPYAVMTSPRAALLGSSIEDAGHFRTSCDDHVEKTLRQPTEIRLGRRCVGDT